MDKIIIRKENFRIKVNLGTPITISNDKDGKSENYKYHLYKDENYNDSDAYLTVIVNSTRPGFTIVGSIRKWWFSNNAVCRDFDLKNFCYCIEAIANKLQIPVDDFWFSRVTQLEIGGTIRLPKSFENTISNIVSFPRLNKNYSYGSETRTFTGKDYNVTVYNKGIEMYKSCSVEKRLLDKINDAQFIMRFEIKLKKISGCMKGRANSLQNIKENWSFLIDYWEEVFKKIEIIEVGNTAYYLEQHYTRGTFKKFLSVVVAKIYGIDFIFNNIDLFPEYKKKSAEKKYFRELCKEYESVVSSESKKIVLEAVRVKAKLMK